MGNKGKLEARITVPTGGYDATVGGVTKTVPAGTYYMSSPGSGARDFLDEVALQFGASSVVGSFSENGTGLVTISFSGATAIDWIDTELRDLLGFTGNLAAAAAHVSTQSARNIWLPDVEWNALNGSSGYWRGYRESDERSASNPAGYVWVVMGQERVCLDDLAWHGLKQAKVWQANETTVNQSLERFWRDGVWGTAAWGTAGGPIRFYPVASLDTGYGTYKPLDSKFFRPEQIVRDYVGIWRWPMPKLIQVPGSEAQGLGGTARDTIAWTLKEAASDTTSATAYATSSQTPNPNHLQILDIIATRGSAVELPLSVVGCGLTWELVSSVFLSDTRVLARYRAMGAAPTAGALTITFATAHTSVLWNWKETGNADTSGSNGAGAIVQTITATAGGGAATTINATFAGALENAANSALAAVGLTIADTVVPDAQFAELGDDNETGPLSTLECQHAANQTACDPTFSASSALILMSEIKARAV